MALRQTLIILAAGLGSRYGGLKQMSPVGPHGETIIDYSVYDALRAGFDRLVCVIRRDMEPSLRLAMVRMESQIPVEYAFQELDSLPQGFRCPPNRHKPWGTAHAVLMAEGLVHEPFAVVNADDFYGRESFRLLAQHLQSRSLDGAMVGFALRNTLSKFGGVSRGICKVGWNGLLQGVTELTCIEKHGAAARYSNAAGQIHSLTGDEIVSMNMWGFPPAIFSFLREEMIVFLKKYEDDEKVEFFLPTVVNTLVASNQIQCKVLCTHDPWFGVTYPQDRPAVVENIRYLIAGGEYPESLW